MTLIQQVGTPADPQGQPRPGVARGRRAAIGGLVAALLLAGVGWALWLRSGVEEGVPSPGNPTATFTLASMKAGKTDFSLGTLVLNHPGKDLQVIAVRPLTSPNIEYLGAIAVWPRDLDGQYASSGGPGFPEARTESYHPIGAVVPAAETGLVPPTWDRPPPVTVTAGFRLASGKVGAVNGVRVVYTVDGEKKSELFPHAVVACVKPQRCGGQEDRDFEDNVLRQLGLFAEK